VLAKVACPRGFRVIALPAPADTFDLAPETDAACLVTQRSHTVALASLQSASITRTIATASEPSIACFRKDGVQIITGSVADRSVTIYDCASGKVVVRLPLALAPRYFCTTADGGQLYITGDGMDAVVTIYPYRTEVAETRLAGHGPAAMAITETNPSYLMVSNPPANSITVLDVDSGKLVAVVQVGKGPNSIIVTPRREYALVLNEGSGDLAVIRIYSLGGNQEGGVRVKRYKSAPVFSLIPVGQCPVSAAVVTFS